MRGIFTITDVCIFAVTVATCAYVYLWIQLKTFSRRGVVALPAYPVVGSLGPVIFRKISFSEQVGNLYKLLKGHRFGGLFEFLKPVLMLRDPDLIKLITVKDFDHFVDRHKPITEECDDMFGKSVFGLEAKTGKMLVVEMKDLWGRYANDVIATAGFGVQVDSLRDPDNEMLANLLHVPLMPFKVKAFVRDLVEQAITMREREDVARPDVIHLLMRRRASDASAGARPPPPPSYDRKPREEAPGLNNEDIAAQVMVFFLAGFETTSTLLSFMSNRLAVLPGIQERLRREVDETLQRHGGRVTYEAVQEMKYLDMVISETLRMYPPVEVLDRKCVRRYVIPASATDPEVVLEPGDAVWVPIYGLHHDPAHWPDPDAFDPERFSDENKANITPFTFLPFGSGPRNCIGLRFAIMEVKVAVMYLLAHFELRVVERTPIDLHLSTNTFNITVDGGFWLGIEPRRRPAPAPA
ncbi:Cytochrome P450 9e2 [Gryllus bimaculatus]|nr:Cytochrome P450 9e2 [Gryllus bimaculatus]